MVLVASLHALAHTHTVEEYSPKPQSQDFWSSMAGRPSCLDTASVSWCIRVCVSVRAGGVSAVLDYTAYTASGRLFAKGC